MADSGSGEVPVPAGGQASNCAGGAGRDRLACEALAERQGLAESVIFHEPVYPEEVPHVPCGLDIAASRGPTEFLAMKLLCLMENATKRREMGLAARRVAAKRFSWGATWGAAMLSVAEGQNKPS